MALYSETEERLYQIEVDLRRLAPNLGAMSRGGYVGPGDTLKLAQARELVRQVRVNVAREAKQFAGAGV